LRRSKLAAALKRRDEREESRSSVIPLAPARRSHVNLLLGARFQPAGEHASAWKYKRMLTVIIYDRQFEIAVEGCGRYWMPFHASERIRNRKSERDETASVKVGPPPTLHLERPLPTAFHNPDSSGDSRRYKTKHVSRTAAVTFITRLDQATSFNIGTNQTGVSLPLPQSSYGVANLR